jgi:hypothetical protein
MVRDDMVRDKDSQRHGMDKDMDMGMDMNIETVPELVSTNTRVTSK